MAERHLLDGQSRHAAFEYRVAWDVRGQTRVKVFEDRSEAREWFRYVTTNWGPDATASMQRRRVDPWRHVQKIGPHKLDFQGAVVM
jgi:hypothetical protein